MRFSEGDLQFLAGVVADGDQRHAAALVQSWRAYPAEVEPHLDDDRVLGRLRSDDRLLVELSPRFLFAVLLACTRRDLGEIPYTIERVHADGRVVVFDAGLSHALLKAPDVFSYLVELLASFERMDTILVDMPGTRRRPRRLSTMSIEDMLELAGLIALDQRPMVFRRIGDIALFTTGLFPNAVLRTRRPLAGAEASFARGVRLEDYEAEGRRFYRLAADRLLDTHPVMGAVLARLAEEFTAARKPLTVLGERYIAWARPHWAQLPS